jgi:hypothetical protein
LMRSLDWCAIAISVMAVLVTAIHVLFSVVQERRGCPGQARA